MFFGWHMDSLAFPVSLVLGNTCGYGSTFVVYGSLESKLSLTQSIPLQSPDPQDYRGICCVNSFLDFKEP